MPRGSRVADLGGRWQQASRPCGPACPWSSPKPPVLWVRGTDDVIVSDTPLYDLAYLGSLGAIRGWPGADAWPPQPMIAQTRAVLDGYAAAGGRYRELVIEDAGHGPHLDQPEQFSAALRDHLTGQ